jgi:hypothetical protein
MISTKEELQCIHLAIERRDMITLIFTLDYEIYGNGQGDLQSLVIDPTNKFIGISNEYGIQVTIFPDVQEFIEMKEKVEYECVINVVESQLKSIIRQGHDVQLHLHPQWYKAIYDGDTWHLDYKRVAISNLPLDDSVQLISSGRSYLENLLREANPDYKCRAFRAGYWCMTPSENILKALGLCRIESDTSVFKWGQEKGPYVNYNYANAFSNYMPWYTDDKDINRKSFDNTGILEIPMYCERARLPALLTYKRFRLSRRAKETTMDLNPAQITEKWKKVKNIFSYYPKKFDFCRLTFPEMKRMINRIIKKNPKDGYLPVFAIGHSKEFLYDRDYRKILRYITRYYGDVVRIETYSKALDKFNTSYKSVIQNDIFVK